VTARTSDGVRLLQFPGSIAATIDARPGTSGIPAAATYKAFPRVEGERGEAGVRDIRRWKSGAVASEVPEADRWFEPSIHPTRGIRRCGCRFRRRNARRRALAIRVACAKRGQRCVEAERSVAGDGASRPSAGAVWNSSQGEPLVCFVNAASIAASTGRSDRAALSTARQPRCAVLASWRRRRRSSRVDSPASRRGWRAAPRGCPRA
jgi:hypothetical protein